MQLTPRLFVSSRDGMVHISNLMDTVEAMFDELDGAEVTSEFNSLLAALKHTAGSLEEWWPKHMDAVAEQFTVDSTPMKFLVPAFPFARMKPSKVARSASGA